MLGDRVFSGVKGKASVRVEGADRGKVQIDGFRLDTTSEGYDLFEDGELGCWEDITISVKE